VSEPSIRDQRAGRCCCHSVRRAAYTRKQHGSAVPVPLAVPVAPTESDPPPPSPRRGGHRIPWSFNSALPSRHQLPTADTALRHIDWSVPIVLVSVAARRLLLSTFVDATPLFRSWTTVLSVALAAVPSARWRCWPPLPRLTAPLLLLPRAAAPDRTRRARTTPCMNQFILL